jgi:predicted dehydrogenase
MEAMTKVAVLGCGYWGKNLVRNFQELGVLAAVVDPSTAASDVLRSVAPGVPLFADARRVLDDATIQAVAIATPTATHVALAHAALEAGKDVLCEKPLALNVEDAERLVRFARHRERVLLVGHLLEYHPAIAELRRVVARGELGAIRYIYSNRLNRSRARHEEDVLWSLAPHDVAVVLRLVGMSTVEVSAMGVADTEHGALDLAVAQLRFQGGPCAHIFVSRVNPFKEQRLVVTGTKKTAVFDDVRRELVLCDTLDVPAGPATTGTVASEAAQLAYPSEEPLRLECEAFLDAVLSRTPPLADGVSALDVVRILEAAQLSTREGGRAVRVAG